MTVITKVQLPEGTQVHLGYDKNEIKNFSSKLKGCINTGYKSNDGYPDLFLTSSITHINQSWSRPTYTSNTTYGSITNSVGSGDAYAIFNGGMSYTPGTNWNGEVTFYWNTSDILNLTGFDYRTATWSHSSYSTSYAKFYGYNYETQDWELMGQRYTSGASDYTDKYYTSLKFLPTDKFQIKIWFNGGANLPSRVHDIIPYGFKYVEAPAGMLNLKVDDGTTYKPLTATFFDGEEVNFTALESIDTSELADGKYNAYLDKLGQITVYNNTHLVWANTPSSPAENDVWVNADDMICYKYNGIQWEEFNQVRLGFFIIEQSAIIRTAVIPYNSNGTNFGPPSNCYEDITLKASGQTYNAPATGWYSIRKNDVSNTILVSHKGYGSTSIGASGFENHNILFVSGGSVVTAKYSTSDSSADKAFRFYYSEGIPITEEI